MFSREICKIFKDIFSYRTRPMAASNHSKLKVLTFEMTSKNEMLDETRSKPIQHENCVKWCWKCCMKCQTNDTVLLHENIHFSETPYIYICILNFCTPLSCNSSIKSHRSSHYMCSTKKLLLKIFQYPQENTCVFNKAAGLHNFLVTYYKIKKKTCEWLFLKPRTRKHANYACFHKLTILTWKTLCFKGIFCKSSYQIYKPIEISTFVLWYHEGNNSGNVYYDPDKIAIKKIRNLKVKKAHFSFVENRRKTKHRPLTWPWRTFQQRNDFCILNCRFVT